MRGKSGSFLFIAIVLAMIGLTGCIRDELSIGTLLSPGLTVMIEVPEGVSTKTSTRAGTEQGSDEENLIEALYITFYTKATGASEWSKLGDTWAITGNDVPDFSTAKSHAISIEGVAVNEGSLSSGDLSLMAVVYANSSTAPSEITSEDDFWDGDGNLEPLFFAGSGVFSDQGGGSWVASVSLSRQVAKLRVKVGIDPAAMSTLEIDESSITVKVENMPDISATVADTDEDPADTFNESNVSRNITRTASDGDLRMELDGDNSWVSGTVVDSLYMHPNTSTEESNAVKVTVSMKVSDSTAGTSQTVTHECYITNSEDTYTTTRNTIYILSVLVQSIDGTADAVNSDLEVVAWDDEAINVDVPWGEIEINHTRTLGMRGTLEEGTYDNMLTITAGPASYGYTVTLVNAQSTSATTVDSNTAVLYLDGTAYYGNTFDIDPSSENVVGIALSSDFTGAYLRIAQNTSTASGVSEGLVRYVTVGGAELTLDGYYTFTYAGGSSFFTTEAYWPENNGVAVLVDVEAVPVNGNWEADGTTYSWVSWGIDTSTGQNQLKVSAMSGTTAFETAVSQRIDLSTENFTGQRETANCYIVNAAGNYTFPLVYGNTIRNGSTNSNAYTAPSSGSNLLTSFVDGRGNTISGAAISNASSGRLSVLWQDVEGLVTVTQNPQSGTYGYYMCNFTVNANALSEGNAVIGLTINNTVVWSWHIWVTQYNPYTSGSSNGTIEVTNYSNNVYQFMRKYLGACDPAEAGAGERTAYFLIRPVDSDMEYRRVQVFQQPQVAGVGDNCYYQPGRKDPMPGFNETSGTPVTKQMYGTYVWPTNSTAPGTTYATSMTTYQALTSQPWVFNTSSLFPNYTNAWNNNLGSVTGQFTSSSHVPDETAVKKTVYDPSPPGFCVPPVGAFTAFATSEPSSSRTSLNILSSDASYLYLSDINGSIVSLRSVSYRNNGNNNNGARYDDSVTKQVTLGTTAMIEISSTQVTPNVIFLVYEYNGSDTTISADIPYIEMSPTWSPTHNNGRCILPIKDDYVY